MLLRHNNFKITRIYDVNTCRRMTSDMQAFDKRCHCRVCNLGTALDILRCRSVRVSGRATSRKLQFQRPKNEKKKKKKSSKGAVGVIFILGGGAGKEHHLLETSQASPARPSSISLRLKCITHKDLVRTSQRTVCTLQEDQSVDAVLRNNGLLL